MDNRLYWEQFYKEHNIKEPSSFAKTLKLKGRRIIDMGCGNGRDTFFLDLMGNDVTGLDEFAPNASGFIRDRIENFLEDNCKCGKSSGHYDTLYMRFILHAVDSLLEDKIVEWAVQNVEEIYIECRSDKGVIPDETHPRRLINGEAIKLKLVSAGFDIKYFAEQTGFAPYKDEDPVIIRLVAKK